MSRFRNVRTLTLALLVVAVLVAVGGALTLQGSTPTAAGGRDCAPTTQTGGPTGRGYGETGASGVIGGGSGGP
nr:collagen-like repeat preface domain-containing protein [Patulibacter sp.]